MKDRRSSIRGQLISSWCALACLFLCGASIEQTAFAASTRDSLRVNLVRSNSRNPARRLGGANNKKRKKENNASDKADDKEEENSKNHQTQATLDSTGSPLQPVTTSPTEAFTSQPTSTKHYGEVQLLPFSVLIHGSLSLEDELDIRKELQSYLLDFLQSEHDDQVILAKTDSIVLEMVQMVESYIPLGENSDNTGGDDLDRSRLLLHVRRHDGYHLDRNMQPAPLTSTVSTLVEYEGTARLQFKEQKKQDKIDDEAPAFQECQIEVLENTNDLQGYFLKWFALGQIGGVAVNTNAEGNQDQGQDYGLQNPVVLMAVKVADRPSKSLDSKETWEAIESFMDSARITDAIDTSTGGGDEKTKHNTNNDVDVDGVQDSDVDGVKDDNVDEVKESGVNPEDNTTKEQRPASPTSLGVANSNSNSIVGSSWKLVALLTGCVLMIIVGLSGILIIRRKKNRQRNEKIGFFSKGIESSGEGADQAMEIISDVDSDEYLESTIHGESALLAETTANGSGGLKLIKIDRRPKTFFSSEILSHSKTMRSAQETSPHAVKKEQDKERIENKDDAKDGNTTSSRNISGRERSSSAKASFTFSPDLVATNMNTDKGISYDEDSMMGYSLISLNRSRNNNEGNQEDINDIEDLDDALSAASSQSDKYNPMFAGVHKILDMPKNDNKSQNPLQDTIQIALQRKSMWKDQQDPSLGLLGDSRNQNEEEESHYNNESEDENTYTTGGSVEEIGDPSMMPGFSSNNDTGNPSYYQGNDDTLAISYNTMSSPPKEIHSAALVLPMSNTATKSGLAMDVNTRFADDTSDAPSDERDNGPAASLPSQYTGDRKRYTEAITKTKLLDDDPAVIEYLLNEERNRNNTPR